MSREHSVASSLCGHEVFPQEGLKSSDLWSLDPWPQQIVQDMDLMAQVWQGKASYYYIVLVFEVYFLWVNWAIAGFPFKLRMGHFLWKHGIIFPDEDGRAGKAGLFPMSGLWFDSITLGTQLETLGCFCLIGRNRKHWIFYIERERKGEKGKRKGRKKKEKMLA